MTKGCINKSCSDQGLRSACMSCRPEIFHTPKGYIAPDLWWTRWETAKELKAVLDRLNKLYRDGTPIIDDKQYDRMVGYMTELDDTYEEGL